MAVQGRWAKRTAAGERVTLRPYAVPDADAVWEMVHDAEGNDLTGTTAQFTREQIDAWVAEVATAENRLDLVIEVDGQFAGEVVLNEYDAERNDANFRIALRGAGWYGRGIGSEATRLMMAIAFGNVGLTRVYLDVLARNPRAIRAYEKAGFVRTREYDEEGERWVDMELTAERWRELA